MLSIRARVLPFIITCGVLFGSGVAGSAEQEPAEQEGGRPTVTDPERSDAKAIFAGQCAWCHGSYGMTADKAPRLAGTKMTDQEVRERIRNGKPNYMPSFRRFLNDEQIALMAKYIKSLVPED